MKQKKFTDLFLVCFAVVFFGITAKAQSIVPKWECSALTDTIVNTNGQIVFEANSARMAIGVNNSIYLPNNTTGCVEKWENGLKRKVWDVNSFMIEKEQTYTYTDSNGETKADFYELWCFGASDDAGNIIVNAGSYADKGHGTKWVVIPADGSAMRLLDIKEFPNSITTGRVYNGVHVVGNLMKEAYLFTADENSGYIIAMNVFPNGTDMGYNLQKSWAIPCSYIGSLLECNIASNTDYETLSNATTLNDFASLIFVRKRTENRIFAWDGSNMYYYIVNNISIGTDGCAAHGFDIFKINNITYYIVPFKNMIDGTGIGRNGSFEIRNFDTGEIVAQYNMSGLVDNINQSFSVETDSDGKSATIYAYCQRNKMGVYSFYPKNNDETILAESLIIESEKVLKVGETAEITATISPTNVSNQNLNWTSSNEDVAIVSNGYVTAISAGTAKLTATTTDGSNLTSTCNITVIDDEENYLTMPSVDLYKGKTVTVPVSLSNLDKFTAFQCDLTLPDGVTCSKVTLSDRASDHTITKSQYSDNVVRIASISFTSSPFSGNDGILFNIELTETESFTEGQYEISLKNIKFSTIDAEEYNLPETTATLTMKTYIKGDANGDGSITITDAVAVVNYVMGNIPASFVFDAADINESGDISITDAVGTVNLLLSQSVSTTSISTQNNTKSIISPKAEITTDGNSLYMQDFTVIPGTENTVYLYMDNSTDYTAFSTDIHFPQGITVTSKKLCSERVSDHMMSSSTPAENVLRLAALSFTNAPFTGVSGDPIVELTISVDENFTGGTITINNAELSTASMDYCRPDKTTADITLDITDGVNDITEDSATSVEYYDLQGVRVENPEKGVYIKRQGGKTTKVVM